MVRLMINGQRRKAGERGDEYRKEKKWGSKTVRHHSWWPANLFAEGGYFHQAIVGDPFAEAKLRPSFVVPRLSFNPHLFVSRHRCGIHEKLGSSRGVSASTAKCGANREES